MYSLNKFVFISLMFFVAVHCSAQQRVKPTRYAPKFETKWAIINDSIKHNWNNVSGKCGPDLVDSFVYSFWCNTQFYWDTYFTQVGLLKHNKIRLAKGGINNLLHLVDSLGFAPNANADWGSNRSQPPYLSMMVKDLYPFLKDKIDEEKLQIFLCQNQVCTCVHLRYIFIMR